MATFDYNTSTVTVIIGVDGSHPPRDILRNVEELVNERVMGSSMSTGKDNVTLTTDQNPSKSEREMLGQNTMYIMKFDIFLKNGIKGSIVNAAHNTVVDVVSSNGFNITGTATVWQGNVEG